MCWYSVLSSRPALMHAPAHVTNSSLSPFYCFVNLYDTSVTAHMCRHSHLGNPLQSFVGKCLQSCNVTFEGFLCKVIYQVLLDNPRQHLQQHCTLHLSGHVMYHKQQFDCSCNLHLSGQVTAAVKLLLVIHDNATGFLT